LILQTSTLADIFYRINLLSCQLFEGLTHKVTKTEI